MRSPTVGVVIPMHNAAPFIGQALASVAAQTTPPAQVVVVDDCSTDASYAAAEAWRGRLPLEIVRLPVNRGVSAARNAGAEALRTDLIALLDADDVWLPDHLGLCLAAYRRNGGIVSAGAFIWRPEGELVDYRRALRLPSPPPAGPAQLRALIAQNFVFVGSLFARADLERVGGFRPPDMVEDWDLWLRLVRDGAAVTQLERPTVLYRRHAGNATRRRSVLLERELELLERARRELRGYDGELSRAIARRVAEKRLVERLDGGGPLSRPPIGELAAALTAGWRTRATALALLGSPRLTRRFVHGEPPPS
ncbi:MAG: glycosyltransferase family 2 protein [Acidimicrobiales bacterium]